MKPSLNNLWRGETAFIVGGGPSLIDFDFSSIRYRRVIGVNNSYLLGDWVDLCWFGDLKWFNWHRKDLKKFTGRIAHCNDRSTIKDLPWMTPFKRGKPLGIEEREGMVAWNRCSGFSAINLAYHMGSKTIVLLGFDMNHNGSQRNWHNDHKEQCTLKDAEGRYKHYLTCCSVIKKDADRLGVRIVNANENSAITQFEKMSLEKFLNETSP